MKKVWVHKAKSFADAEKFEEDYYRKMPIKERLETMQFLREEYYKMNREAEYESRKGLRRIFKRVKQE